MMNRQLWPRDFWTLTPVRCAVQFHTCDMNLTQNAELLNQAHSNKLIDWHKPAKEGRARDATERLCQDCVAPLIPVSCSIQQHSFGSRTHHSGGQSEEKIRNTKPTSRFCAQLATMLLRSLLLIDFDIFNS